MQSIRSRLIVVFAICFSFIVGLTCLDYFHIFVLEKKIGIIQQFDDFHNDVLELRRYEKNYFLTGKKIHIKQMLHYLTETEELFLDLKNQIQKVLDPARYDTCGTALKEYRHILEQNNRERMNPEGSIKTLRARGKILTEFSEELIREKRKRLKRTLRRMLLLPIAFSMGFIILVLAVMHMTWENILKPLRKIQNAAEKAGRGDFKPIADSKIPQKNEVSQCIRAFNNMITEIDLRQEQLLQSRKMASIGVFTSGIAHELNNPINNISLVVDSLMEEEESMTSEERKSLYRDLMDQADRSSEIVKNLLEFSRTDHGDFESISLKEMLEKTLRLVRNELKLHKIKLHRHIQEDLPKITIDKSRLQQALVNLLLNCIQAMPEGGDLTVSLSEETTPEKCIRIDIRDTGMGISQKDLNFIFDPFFTTKKEGEGTGLGLSVTYNIIKSYNGRINVESEPGKGTCFSIFLPVDV